MRQSRTPKPLVRHPFSRAYWKDAYKECTDFRSIFVAALLCACAILIEKYQIPLSPGLYISLSFFVISLCSMLTGPVMAILCGVLVDLIGAIGSPYPFFAGYTLTAVLTAVIYALFLYRVQLTFFRVAVSKFCINLFVNTLLNSVWRYMMLGGAYSYHAVVAGVKNLVLLPLEVFLICTLFRALQKPLQQEGFLSAEAGIDFSKRDTVLLSVAAAVGAILLIVFASQYDAIKAFLAGLF